MKHPLAYRGYIIEHRRAPVPTTTFDYAYWHESYDGAPDANDNRCGFASSLEEAMAAIDEQIDDYDDGCRGC